MVLLTQHYDTVTSVGAQSKSTIMLLPYTPNGMQQVGDQVTQALLASNTADQDTRPERPAKSAPPRPTAQPARRV